jgi:hypothetical protein
VLSSIQNYSPKVELHFLLPSSHLSWFYHKNLTYPISYCHNVPIYRTYHKSAENSDRLMLFQVLTAKSVKMAVFWGVAPCSLVEVYCRFRGAYCLHHHSDALATQYNIPSSITSLFVAETGGRSAPVHYGSNRCWAMTSQSVPRGSWIEVYFCRFRGQTAHRRDKPRCW